MNSADAKQFRNLIAGMGRMYGSEPDALILDAYWIALGDWNREDFETACRRLMATSKFMPRPSDFNDLRIAGEETAGEVFANLSGYCIYTPRGYVLAPNTPRPIASAIAAIGGANAYSMCAVEDLHFLERRFCRHYEEISAVTARRKLLPQITYGGADDDSVHQLDNDNCAEEGE